MCRWTSSTAPLDVEAEESGLRKISILVDQRKKTMICAGLDIVVPQTLHHHDQHCLQERTRTAARQFQSSPCSIRFLFDILRYCNRCDIIFMKKLMNNAAVEDDLNTEIVTLRDLHRRDLASIRRCRCAAKSDSTLPPQQPQTVLRTRRPEDNCPPNVGALKIPSEEFVPPIPSA